MFVLLYVDDFLRRGAVLDTKDKVVETLPMDTIFDIVRDNNLTVKGLITLGLKYATYPNPYPAFKCKKMPRNAFIVNKVFINKGEYSRHISVHGYKVQDGILDASNPVIVRLNDSSDIKGYYFSQNVFVQLDDAYMSETYSWKMVDGVCDKFSDRVPYNANMGTEVCEEMLGDFICKFLAKGYLNLRDFPF